MFTRQQATLLLVASVMAVHTATASPPMLRTVCGAVADAEEVVGNKALEGAKVVGGMIMKPIAIVGGLKAAAVGTVVKASGAGIKFVGAKMAKDGAIMEAAGAGVKGAGLGVAAMGLKPAAEKIVAAGKVAEGSLAAASQAADQFAHSIGDTSIVVDARLDSPILGHHHKNVNMTAGLDTASQQVAGNEIKGQVEQQVVQQQETVPAKQEEVQQRTKRATKIDPEVMRAAFNLVKEGKMEDCVARAVCDLNCNPQGFGQEGKQVFMSMVKLQGTKILDESDMKLFKEAADKGRKHSGSCDECATIYKNCKSKSTDLIKMASHIRMD
jgi:hypothetical protein